MAVCVKMTGENEKMKEKHQLYSVKTKFEKLPHQKSLWTTYIFYNNTLQFIYSLLL